MIYIVHFYCIEQDDGLNELASIVSRQKNIAITISSEVDLQNGRYKTIKCYLLWLAIKVNYYITELVDDLLVKIDKTTAGLESETKEVVQILKKDSTRGI